MTENKLNSRLHNPSRSKRSITMPERQIRPYAYRPSRLRPRQAPQRPNEPELAFDGDETSSDESSLDGESDSEGEDDSSDEEEESEDANPFAASRVSGTGARTTISATTTTTMSDNPFATAAVTATLSYEPGTSTLTSSPTSQKLVQATATGVAADSDAPAASSSGGQSKHTTAVALGSVLGVLSVAVAAYLLFRYCAPIRNRVARYRGRKGSKLPREEDGVPPQNLGRGVAQSGDFAATNAHRYSKAVSSIATPAPSYTHDTAIAVPITSTRVPAPVSIHPGSRDDDPENPFSDYARTLSRNNTNKSSRSKQPYVQNSGASDYETSRPTTDMLDEPGTYAFNFNFDDYRLSGTDLRQSALTNNPLFATSGSGATNNSLSNSVKGSADPYSSGIGSGLGIDVPTSPGTPKPATFSIPYAPPSEVATPRTQYMPRQRQSITPSESVSNAPYSPLPFPAGLMPALPAAMNSRWSKNSSSVWARTVDDKGVDLPESPAKAVTRPPPLPLTVRTSTSSFSSRSSNGSKRSSSRSSVTGPGQDPIEKRSTLQPAPTQRLKTGSTIIGLPTSVRPVSNTGSGVTLKPVAYRP
ncbi:uncharacterized protein A1O9_04529 [Exophiala aquamarina CBS 119918]|uniref:Uncharacterized protein n=1 Tax=Exophiala aquamarina CBS 119918 TaxID=1182545 RepID=A0A072PK39_9EURO|nr:uncharacterized protein A1O9_04529 [Exophiala aquamarina CBS 119918]KEF59683.1 hypothetical protein A1O9_04529 [Exophiala aquamarina CBS 119918]